MFEISAPAKINLSLRVLGKRADGFHEIETLIAPLGLADQLFFEEAEAFSFSCDDPTVPGDESNLVVRAARLFFSATGLPDKIAIRLEKRIPHGAGLGGGSSDAAATLLMLNAHFQSGLSPEELMTAAAELGSDVPVFLRPGEASWCRGRGESVSQAGFRERLPLLLLKPAFGVPTPWAYQQWQGSREMPGIDYAAQLFPWGELVNDLERPVFEKYLVLPAMKGWLREQPEAAGALMSGSGATVFALLRDPSGAGPLARRAREMFGETLWTCATYTLPEMSDVRPRPFTAGK